MIMISQIHLTCISILFGMNSVKSIPARACPCQEPEWCKPVTKYYKNEIFVFSVTDANWKLYDWNKITTVVLFGSNRDPQLVCHAHSKGTRVVIGANFPTANLTNSADRSKWVTQKVEMVLNEHVDGINVDFEDYILAERKDLQDGLTSLMKELTTQLKASINSSQVTFDVAWSPNCIDVRCYDYLAIASIVDFLFVMAYDERSQIFGPCISWANSALNNTIQGIYNYTMLGIPPDKLVLGVPWYGYDYPCIKYNRTSTVCYIKEIPFRNVSCSDAAGQQVSYTDIMENLIKESHVLWDPIASSPYFSYNHTSHGMMHQVWFDDVQSLKPKYDFALKAKLRGVGMWNADSLDYSNTTAGHSQRKEMWGILPDYGKKISSDKQLKFEKHQNHRSKKKKSADPQ